MRLSTALLLSLVAALALAPAASAKPKYRLGMGDQEASMFADPNFQALNIKRVRYIVPWDVAEEPGQAAEVEGYMNMARFNGKEVLVAFSARRGCFDGRYSRSRSCRAPSKKAFTSAFKAFREKYPYVKTYSAWNEANHVSQPTYRRPGLAVRYWDVLRRECKRCKIVALDLLDSSNMGSYIRSFRRQAKGGPRVWGIHNYADVNRRRSTKTREILRAVPGEVWMTETGGLVTFLPSFKYSPSRAAKRTRDMFKLADAYDTRRRGMRSRITRVYPYQYTGVGRQERFDAGLVTESGETRPAYDVFKRFARNRLK